MIAPRIPRFVPFFALVAALACSSEDSGDGSPSSGGTTASGGSSGKGGGSSNGGTGQGGASGKGGASSTGGASGNGGNASGGGGAPSSGGVGGGAAGDGSAGESASAGAAGEPSLGGSAGEPGTNGGAPGEGGAAGGGGEASGTTPTVEACLELANARDTQTERLELAGDDVIVGIVRYADPDSFGTSGTTPWLPDTFAVAYETGTLCVRDAASLSYTSSHHNFDDVLTATNGARTWTFRQEREDYDQPTRWTVSASEGGSSVLDPVELTLVECRVLGSNEDCSQRYE